MSEENVEHTVENKEVTEKTTREEFNATIEGFGEEPSAKAVEPSVAELLQSKKELEEYIEAQRRQLEELKGSRGVHKQQGPEKTLMDANRVYEGQVQIDHDLFVLKLTGTKKEVGYNRDPKAKMFQTVNHEHRYHSHDSNGRGQQFSCIGLGHSHEVLVEYDDEGKIVGAKCSPPMTKYKGKMVPYKNDNHTHEIKYVRSEKIAKRTVNEEGAKVLSAYFQQENQAARNAIGI